MVEKSGKIEGQRSDREIFRGAQFTLSVASEIGVNDAQLFGRDRGALRSQKPARLSNVAAYAVLEDQGIQKVFLLPAAAYVMQTNITVFVEGHNQSNQFESPDRLTHERHGGRNLFFIQTMQD